MINICLMMITCLVISHFLYNSLSLLPPHRVRYPSYIPLTRYNTTSDSRLCVRMARTLTNSGEGEASNRERARLLWVVTVEGEQCVITRITPVGRETVNTCLEIVICPKYFYT